MTDKKTVFIVGGGADYAAMFKNAGWGIGRVLEEADLVQFTGGSDVTPSLYGELPHPTTGSSRVRDDKEIEIYNFCLGAGLPMAGICRGGQFLNVMNGGKMWQNVDGHATGKMHKATALGHIGDVMVTSTHHQMIRPNMRKEFIILMRAREATFKESTAQTGMTYRYVVNDNNKNDSNYDDVESVYYPETNCLCYQPHPEFLNCPECRATYFYFLNNYLMNNLNIEEAHAKSREKWN